MRHYRNRRDANHAPIVQALRAAGRTVIELDSLGGGCPDILVGWGMRHVLLMEIKAPRTDKGGGSHPVTPNQVKWHREWKGPRVAIVRSVEEALAVTGVHHQGYPTVVVAELKPGHDQSSAGRSP